MTDLTKYSHINNLSTKKIKLKYKVAAGRLANAHLYALGRKPARHPVPSTMVFGWKDAFTAYYCLALIRQILEEHKK